jgi:hypothetical protein
VTWATAGRRLWLKATSVFACVVAALATGCADEPRAVDPARLPESVDVGPLRGRALSQTPCSFVRELAHDSPGSGVIRLWLDCGDRRGTVRGPLPLEQDADRVGFVEVERVRAAKAVDPARVRPDPVSGGELVDDSIRCYGDPRSPTLQSCILRHGRITVHTRAWCATATSSASPAPDIHARCSSSSSEEKARKLMARIMGLLATLPEQPCRLCPQYVPPDRQVELPKSFSGTEPTQLGTIDVPLDARIRYFAPRGIRVTSGRPPRVLIEATQRQGEADIPRGTYRNVKVTSSGDWNFLIELR